MFWSLVIGFPLPFFTAVMLNEMVHGKEFFKIGLYLPVIVSPIATCMVWKMLYMDGSGGILNMIRSMFGLEPMQWLSNGKLAIPLIVISMTWHGFGSTVVMYLASLQGINQELYEAARIDGCSDFKSFIKIILPLSKPIIMVVSIFSVTGTWGNFMWPFLMLGGTDREPVAVMLYQMGQGILLDNDYYMLLTLSIIPMAIVFALFSKQIMGGLSVGGLKG